MIRPPLIVIFGAAVRADGQASAALLRRIGFGLAAAAHHAEAPILCSGGAVRPGPTEASIMAQSLAAAGVASDRLILDEASLSTLDNVAAVVRQVAAGAHPDVVACSDAYHLPRVRLLLAMHGVRSTAWPAAAAPPLVHGVGMALREAVAVPHSVARALARRAAFKP